VALQQAAGRGVTFRASLDLVEAMGAEFYAHFGADVAQADSAELHELREDSGGDDIGGGNKLVMVARLSPKSTARSGAEAELWLDATKLHFFDAESGHALTNGR
jgi:multiple sugar transport system ATP-binding protein